MESQYKSGVKETTPEINHASFSERATEKKISNRWEIIPHLLKQGM
jgi:hypothetical protein